MFWLSPLAIVPLLCAGGMLISYAALGLIARPIVGMRGMAPIAGFSFAAFLACLIEALSVSTNRPEMAYWLEAARAGVWLFLTVILALWFERLVSRTLRFTAVAIVLGVIMASSGALWSLREIHVVPTNLWGSFGVLRPVPRPGHIWMYVGLLLPSLAMVATILRADQRTLPRKTLLAGITLYIACLGLDAWSAAYGSTMPRMLVMGLLSLQLAIHRATGHKLVAEYRRTHTMNELRSQMMDSLSHELRTPLGVVKGYLEMTLEGFFGPLSEPQTKALSTALDNVNQEVLLIDDLLLSAQLERGHTTVVRDRVSLNALLQQTLARTARHHRDKAMRPTLQLGTDHEWVVYGDATLLAKLFDRIVDNAWIYAPDDTVIHISVTEDSGTGLLTIAVSDAGPGIAPELIAQIAEPFAQASTSSEGQVKGLGLGLSLAREICRLHGGQLTLRNNPEGGLTALIQLPTGRTPA